MKKILIVFASFSLLSSACHYGTKDANESLKRNDTYKEIKNERQSPVPADDYIESQGKPGTADSSAVTPTDSTVKAK